MESHSSSSSSSFSTSTKLVVPLNNLKIMNEEGCVPHFSDGVKQKSIDQRAPLPGEPRCVICSRYGEYICDETNDDICSLECKQTLLGKVDNTRAFPATDECFYVRDPGSSSFTDAQLLRSKLEINVQGAAVPPPVLTFTSCGLPPKLLLNLETAGYEFPTPIQMQAIPAALSGKSLLASADTGSGKTASFLVPIVSRCTTYRSEHSSDLRNPLAMVLAPTRELCLQVEDQAKMLAKGLPFKTALVVGGDPMSGQLYRIQQGVELIIGTPGRLVDLLAKHAIELDDIMTFVLDEVDCMLQRGFRDQVMQIFRALSQPQVLLFSATVSREVEKVGGSLAKEIISISIGKPNKPNRAVNQLAIWVDAKQKKQKLFEILRSQNHFKPPAVVYVSSRVGADLLANAITVVTGIKALSIHGEKPMKERRNVMGSFLGGEVPVLVSTGVLGRGVDLLVVRQVIVFDMPNTIKEYIHVIGRASRMGEQGTAILFVNEDDRNLFPDLVAALKSCGAAIPKEQKLFEILRSQNHFKPPAVVYVSSRVGADLLANAITVVTGIKALSIHGEKPMKERRNVMGSFLGGEVPVLVSTGVLGRGVDLLVVRQVIVFDMPNTIKEYIHVIGRASRMGEQGTAILFVNEDDRNLFPDLVAALKSCGAAIPKELINLTSREMHNKKRRVGY